MATAKAQESTPTSPLATPAADVTPTPTANATGEATPTPTLALASGAMGADCVNVSYGTLAATELVTATNSEPAVQPISPPNPNGPTAVDVVLNVQNVSDIDVSADSYAIEGFMDVTWCDPRLRRSANATTQLFKGTEVETRLAEMWSPALTFTQQIAPMRIGRPELQVHTDGTVQYRSKFLGVLETNYTLHAYPFDRQDLVLSLRSFAWPADALVIQTRLDGVHVPEDIEIPEWQYLGVATSVEAQKEDDERVLFSVLQATLSVQRLPGVYLSKILIPLAIITLLTMAIFWLDGDAFDIRLSGGMTGLLTSIAYQFIASDALPGYVFNTYLDAFIWMSFIWIVVALVESGYVAWLHKAERVVLAQKTDQIARRLVPALYLLSTVILYFVYTRVLA